MFFCRRFKVCGVKAKMEGREGVIMTEKKNESFWLELNILASKLEAVLSRRTEIAGCENALLMCRVQGIYTLILIPRGYYNAHFANMIKIVFISRFIPWHMLCWWFNATHTHTRKHTHTSAHTLTHTHTHTHKQAPTHSRTHTHTNTASSP